MDIMIVNHDEELPIAKMFLIGRAFPNLHKIILEAAAQKKKIFDVAAEKYWNEPELLERLKKESAEAMILETELKKCFDKGRVILQVDEDRVVGIAAFSFVALKDNIHAAKISFCETAEDDPKSLTQLKNAILDMINQHNKETLDGLVTFLLCPTEDLSETHVIWGTETDGTVLIIQDIASHLDARLGPSPKRPQEPPQSGSGGEPPNPPSA